MKERVSKRVPIIGEDEPVKCAYCNRWAVRRSPVSQYPLCTVHSLAFMDGIMEGKLMLAMEIHDSQTRDGELPACPKCKSSDTFQDDAEPFKEYWMQCSSCGYKGKVCDSRAKAKEAFREGE